MDDLCVELVLPKCPICGAEVQEYCLNREENEERVVFNCGRQQARTVNFAFTGSYPNGRNAVYKRNAYSVKVRCANAETELIKKREKEAQ